VHFPLHDGLRDAHIPQRCPPIECSAAIEALAHPYFTNAPLPVEPSGLPKPPLREDNPLQAAPSRPRVKLTGAGGAGAAEGPRGGGGPEGAPGMAAYAAGLEGVPRGVKEEAEEGGGGSGPPAKRMRAGGGSADGLGGVTDGAEVLGKASPMVVVKT